MIVKTLAYEADGLSMKGQFFVDDGHGGPVPGILVFPEAFGLGEHALSRARRLAESGYAALACDLHGGAAHHDDLQQVLGLLAPIRNDPARIRARAVAALDALRAQEGVDRGRTAAIGFCFGGTMALELARSGADIRAAVGFHSGLATAAPQDAANITAKVLACIGADDPAVPPEQRAAFEAEMRAGKVDWQLHLYGGVVHSYTDPAADARGQPAAFRYDARADARAWAAMQALFAEVLA
jgi:dienelactone hydrolase